MFGLLNLALTSISRLWPRSWPQAFGLVWRIALHTHALSTSVSNNKASLGLKSIIPRSSHVVSCRRRPHSHALAAACLLASPVEARTCAVRSPGLSGTRCARPEPAEPPSSSFHPRRRRSSAKLTELIPWHCRSSLVRQSPSWDGERSVSSTGRCPGRNGWT